MNETAMMALAKELAKGLKTESDLNDFTQALKKLTIETALNAELPEHLGHEKHNRKSGSNTRNGLADLKKIYQSATEDAALQALDEFGEKWDDQYPQISKSWLANWTNLNTFFSYPPDIRKAIYTTNAIESLNSVIRHATKKRKIFPSDDSVKKVVYLAIISASQKWTMPIHNWKAAMSRFIIMFEDRMADYM